MIINYEQLDYLAGYSTRNLIGEAQVHRHKIVFPKGMRCKFPARLSARQGFRIDPQIQIISSGNTLFILFQSLDNAIILLLINHGNILIQSEIDRIVIGNSEKGKRKGGRRMQERDNVITMRGNPLTLVGTELKVGASAPDFQVTGNDLKPVSLSDHEGKVVIISAVPSLDTPVCDMETRRFNTEAAKLGSEVVILTISMDLPFAQKRWCGAVDVRNVITLSDHKTASFGLAYGVLIKELRLLARAVFVLGKDRLIHHLQIVNEIADEPDYDRILSVAKGLV